MSLGIIAQTFPAISPGCAQLHDDIITMNNHSCPWTLHPAEVVSSADHSWCNQGLLDEGQRKKAV